MKSIKAVIKKVDKILDRYTDFYNTSTKVRGVPARVVRVRDHHAGVAIGFEDGSWTYYVFSYAHHSGWDGAILDRYNVFAAEYVRAAQKLGKITKEEYLLFSDWFSREVKEWERVEEIEGIRREANRLGYSICKKRAKKS
jgi:hypothetical protein